MQGIAVVAVVCKFLIYMQVNSSGVMPIIFSTSSLSLPGTLARFTGLAALKNAAIALNPGGKAFFLLHFTKKWQTVWCQYTFFGIIK